MSLASSKLLLRDAHDSHRRKYQWLSFQFVIKNIRREVWYLPGDGLEAATCLFLHKINLFLVKDNFNFVALSQALDASHEITMYVDFPFMVGIKVGGFWQPRFRFCYITLCELLGTMSELRAGMLEQAQKALSLYLLLPPENIILIEKMSKAGLENRVPTHLIKTRLDAKDKRKYFSFEAYK